MNLRGIWILVVLAGMRVVDVGLGCMAWASEPKPVTATIETTLSTAGSQIRQLALDGAADTFFASGANVGPRDHFTLRFDRPLAIHSIVVMTGRPDGDERLEAGDLEASADGKMYRKLADFDEGTASSRAITPDVVALRIQPTQELQHALAVREFTIDSNPRVETFKYPVEFAVDVSDAPEMKAWTENTARVCERAYAMINDELKSEDYSPPRLVRMTMRRDYQGVAATAGDRIVGSVKFFAEHSDDVGAMVHETVHVVQQYRNGNNPSWLVEGVADYVRFFKFEPGKVGPIDRERAHYNGSYRVTATFLAFLVEKYDRHLVRKLNEAMRSGRYRDDIFKELTGRTLEQLDEEWRASLGR